MRGVIWEGFQYTPEEKAKIIKIVNDHWDYFLYVTQSKRSIVYMIHNARNAMMTVYWIPTRPSGMSDVRRIW